MKKRIFLLAIAALLTACCKPPATPTPTQTVAPLASTTLIASTTLTAYTITANSTDGGQISPSSLIVSHGESATFQVTASTGYVLSSIEGCPGVLKGDQFTIESVTSACELNVGFSPAMIAFRTVLVEENIWEYRTSERMPDYEYAGQQYEGSLVSILEAGSIVADLWQDGFPDVLIPLVKGYASGIDTRLPPVLFKNDGNRFQEASDELVGGMPSIPGLRRTVAISDPGDGFKGVFGIAHDTGDGNAADALLLTAGTVPENVTGTLPRLPLADAFGRANAVDAHSMAAGDLNGDGMTDFVVGEFSWLDNPYKLIQVEPGEWEVVEDPFLASLAYEHPMENPDAGDGANLLLDLHLADVDGDSFDDLVVGWGHGSTRSYVYINDGRGGFSNEDKKALPVSIYGVDNSLHMKTWSFDANNDGHLDLLINYSRYVPYYGGYTLQLLLNDGNGNFQDHTVSGMRNIERRDRSIGGRLTWSDCFYLLDVNRDSMVDIVGSDQEGVRVWINESDAVFREVPVNTHDAHRGGTHIFLDMGNGVVSSLVFRSAWNADGTEIRIVFDQANLVMEMLPIPTPIPAPSVEQFEEGYAVYTDELNGGWSQYFWGGTADLFSSAKAYRGTNSIEVALEPGGAITFDKGSFDASAYDYIVFYLNGGDTADQQLHMRMKSKNGYTIGETAYLDDYIEGYPLKPGQWHWVAVPINLLNPEGKPIAWFEIGDASGEGASTFYIDEIRFVSAKP